MLLQYHMTPPIKLSTETLKITGDTSETLSQKVSLLGVGVTVGELLEGLDDVCALTGLTVLILAKAHR